MSKQSSGEKTVLDKLQLLWTSHFSLSSYICRFHEIFEYLVGSGKRTCMIGWHSRLLCVCVSYATTLSNLKLDMLTIAWQQCHISKGTALGETTA